MVGSPSSSSPENNFKWAAVPDARHGQRSAAGIARAGCSMEAGETTRSRFGDHGPLRMSMVRSICPWASILTPWKMEEERRKRSFQLSSVQFPLHLRCPRPSSAWLCSRHPPWKLHPTTTSIFSCKSFRGPAPNASSKASSIHIQDFSRKNNR